MSARFVLLAAALLAAGIARAAEPAAEPVPPAPEFAAPGAANVASLWEEFLERGNSSSVEALTSLTDVLDEDGEVDAGRCRDRRSMVERATKVAPVSLGAWYFAQQCAQALGDDAWAEAALAAFAALSRHALLASGTNEWSPPIRVVAAIDIDAFVLASGEKLLYRYVDLYSLPRWMVYRVALRESDTSMLRRYRFDYLDTIMRLTHEPGWDAPAVRREVVRSWIHDADGDDDATEAGAAWDALAQDDRATTTAQLRELARDGNLFATLAYANTCLGRGVPCASDAVDLLLPLAEIRMPEAMILLAVANGAGLGMKADEKSARALLDAAGQRLPPGDAEAMFVLSWAQKKGAGDVPRWARKAVLEAARAGNSTAVVAYAATTVKHDRVAKDALELLEADYGKRKSAPSAYLLAMNATGTKGGGARFAQMLRAAAEAGYQPAYAPMAAMLERGPAGNEEEARRWRLEAARGGDVESMRKVGDWYAEGSPPRDEQSARIWYANATTQDDTVAALRLAKLLIVPKPDQEDDLKAAAELLKALVERGDAEARRLYADLLVLGRGVERDPAAAEKLLREAIAAGDAEAQWALGIWLAQGELGADRVAEGIAALEKAGDGGHGAALDALAQFRLWGHGGPVDAAAAKANWERAVAGGYLPAFNDYAWHLCTVPDGSFVDGRRGLEVLVALSERQVLEWDVVDTKAACHAAAGDFDAAVATQQRAIDAASVVGVSEETMAGMAERLARYRNRERAVMARPDFLAAAAARQQAIPR